MMDLMLLLVRFLGSYFAVSMIFYPAYLIKKHNAEDPEEVSYNTLGSIILTVIVFLISL